MSDETEDLAATAVKSQEQSAEVMTKLFAVAQPRAVFGEPVSAGEQTVITASEVRVGMGFGYGIGRGTGPGQEEVEAAGEGSSRANGPAPAMALVGVAQGRPAAGPSPSSALVHRGCKSSPWSTLPKSPWPFSPHSAGCSSHLARRAELARVSNARSLCDHRIRVAVRPHGHLHQKTAAVPGAAEPVSKNARWQMANGRLHEVWEGSCGAAAVAAVALSSPVSRR